MGLYRSKDTRFIVDKGLLEQNLKKLAQVKERTGCKILLAQKAFSMYSMYPLIGTYLDGTCASSLDEARLGREEMGKEVHTFGAAYPDEDFDAVVSYSDVVIFNSIGQAQRLHKKVHEAGKQWGIRINPEYSEVEVALYDPCAPCSRLGVTCDHFDITGLEGMDGLHLHVMCEQNSDTLQRVLSRVEEKFGEHLHGLSWLNLGGGHHITRADYDIDLLCSLITEIQQKYNLQVILEPGEAVALNCGVLVASVLDIVTNGMELIILDTSAETHMPDVLAMPYRPQILGAGDPGEFPHTYRLGGMTCLAGDVIGDYSFQKPLRIGDRVVFLDMAIYSMVKTTTFNGIKLPDICIREDAVIKQVRRFSHSDFKSRL